MRVFVVGASGAIGTRLVPQLIDRGHEVIGTFRSPEHADRVRALGAEALQLDLLDPRAVRKAVLETEPEAIVHQATALANAKWGRNFDKVFARTNELRTKGTDALLAAAREASVSRFVGQSFASMRYAREGGPVKTEEDPLDPSPPKATREGQAAMRYLDQTVTDAGGIALRYGGFYGAANDGLVEPVRKRQFPIVDGGGGVFSFIHLDDAAAATVLALEHDGPAIYNIVDDEPAAAPSRPGLARAADRGRTRGHHRNRVPRRLEREGQAGARLDAALPELAAGLRRRLRDTGGLDIQGSRGQVLWAFGLAGLGASRGAREATPSLSWGAPLPMELLRQPVATDGNGFGLFEPPSGPCDLPPVATGCDHGAPQRLDLQLSDEATAVRPRVRLVHRGRLGVGAAKPVIRAWKALRQNCSGLGRSGLPRSSVHAMPSPRAPNCVDASETLRPPRRSASASGSNRSWRTASASSRAERKRGEMAGSARWNAIEKSAGCSSAKRRKMSATSTRSSDG